MQEHGSKFIPVAQCLEHRWPQVKVPGASPGGDSQLFLQTYPISTPSTCAHNKIE